MEKVSFEIKGQPVPTGITNWDELSVKINFDEEIQSAIDIDDAVFSGEEVELLKTHINNGLNGFEGIYEGVPIKSTVNNEDNSATILDAFLNFNEGYVLQKDCKLITKINLEDDILTFTERLQSISYGFLKNEGVITNKDLVRVPYLVQKYDQNTELALLAITTFLTLKETAEGFKAIGKTSTDLIKAVTPNVGLGVTPDTGDIISLAILLALQIAYVASMISYLLRLMRDLLDFIYPPVRYHYGLRLSTMLEKAAIYLGYEFENGIDELSDIVYISSKPEDKDKTGVPRPEDLGYNCNEIYELVKRAFRGVVQVKNNKVIVRTAKDPYWIQDSGYVLKDILHEKVEYNQGEIIGNKLIIAETDTIDGWTIADYKGTSVAVKTQPKTDSNYNLINGFERVDLGVVLGSRKGSLNDFEKALKAVAQLIDDLINFFGGNSDLVAGIENRVGYLRQTNRIHSVPKMVKLVGDNNKVASKQDFSAKYLYDNYLNYDSFVQNNYQGQKRIYKEIENLPFCLEDFLKVSKNSYFTTNTGQVGKFTDLDWAFGKQKAKVSYWIREVFTKNLKEDVNEQE